MSDHNAPIPPPVQKPSPDARMMQAMTGEWLWAVPCELLGPQPAADLRALREKVWNRSTTPVHEESFGGRLVEFVDKAQVLLWIDAALASAPQPAEGRTQEKEP